MAELEYTDLNKSYEAALERSKKIEADLLVILRNTAY